MNLPAFPAMHFDLADNEHGLTMRDYFAAKAMNIYFQGHDVSSLSEHPDSIAIWCYHMADAMMEARNAAQ